MSDRLTEIEARVNALPPGSWIVAVDNVEFAGVPQKLYRLIGSGRIDERMMDPASRVPPAMDFVAHAREDVPWLVELAKQARALANAIFEAETQLRIGTTCGAMDALAAVRQTTAAVLNEEDADAKRE